MTLSPHAPLPVWRRHPAAATETMAADYASAMYAVRTLGDALVLAQARGASVEERRALHARVDRELARAITAASAVYERLFEAAGGTYHAETQPEVALWKRRLENALTVRTQHQLAEIDDAGVVVPSTARPADRAALGPHQPGMDFG